VAVLLAAPVSAQTLLLRASVPFDFVVAGHTCPRATTWLAKFTARGL